MTNDEAIEIIECGEISNRWGKDGEEVEKMAIKALKQEPCEDAISRQAAIDACDQSINLFEAVDRIKELPFVNPQKPKSEWQQDHEILKAYSDGANEMLDKIRAEIDEQYDRVHPYDISCAEGLEMALDIIDKYKSGGSGE